MKRNTLTWATSENRHRGCWRDMLGQTVPSKGISNREGPIVDGGQPCMTDIQRQRKQIEGVSGPRNQPCTRAHQRDTTVLSRADTCAQEQQAWTDGSSPVLSASAVGGGAEWYGRTSTKRKRVARPSSWLTGAAGEGTMECQPRLHCRSPVVTGRVTTSATGERLENDRQTDSAKLT